MYSAIFTFENLYNAHLAARLGKRRTPEEIAFELDFSRNIMRLSDELKKRTYRPAPYYSFYVHDPKKRKIHALHYADRVVQHCLCDNILRPLFECRLIYDNAACRIAKGTHFALMRVSGFMSEFYRKNGDGGWFLKCDISKFFDSIDHRILKNLLAKAVKDTDILALLYRIIDGYHSSPGKGLPLGNQTSQWFAMYYLDSFDRIIKEKFRIKYYSRYMDDCVLISHDKSKLKYMLEYLSKWLWDSRRLKFNAKTQIISLKNGTDYLGFHIYVGKNGRIIRKVRQRTSKKFAKKLKMLKNGYNQGKISVDEIKQVINSYSAHLSHGSCKSLMQKRLSDFVI